MRVSEGRGLLEFQPVRLRVLPCLLLVYLPMRRVNLCSVNLITDQIDDAIGLRLSAKLLHPALGIYKGVFLGHVIDDERANCSAVVTLQLVRPLILLTRLL